MLTPAAAQTDSSATSPRRASVTSSRIMWAVAAATLLLHLLTATNYGYFRDELYFLACSRHLAAGYVDMAPLIAWVTALVRVTLGESLFAIHLVPAIAAARDGHPHRQTHAATGRSHKSSRALLPGDPLRVDLSRHIQ